MTPPSTDRFTLVETDAQVALDTLAQDVARGLTAAPKTLRCRHFYDQRGSALFEAICDLPEYYLTRAEREILLAHAGAIATSFTEPVTLIELGSGSAVKTRLLIEALLAHQQKLLFVPVDISQTALKESAVGLLGCYDELEVLGVAAPYDVGLAHLHAHITGPRLALWLGSSVGNFAPGAAVAFLRDVATALDGEADRLLIGMDLHKDGSVLARAYADAQGVTADFNLNLLRRINRELGGRFDLARFSHRAFYDEARGRVEMHIVSKRAQTVAIDLLDLDIAFADGETIHTENAYKYRIESIPALLAEAGFVLERQFFDRQRRFSLNLAYPRR